MIEGTIIGLARNLALEKFPGLECFMGNSLHKHKMEAWTKEEFLFLR